MTTGIYQSWSLSKEFRSLSDIEKPTFRILNWIRIDQALLGQSFVAVKVRRYTFKK
jgi:hypothetical protein